MMPISSSSIIPYLLLYIFWHYIISDKYTMQLEYASIFLYIPEFDISLTPDMHSSKCYKTRDNTLLYEFHLELETLIS